MIKHLKNWLIYIITIDNFVIKNLMQLFKSTSFIKKIRSGKVEERYARMIIIVINCVQTSTCVIIYDAYSCRYLTKEGELCVKGDLPEIQWHAVMAKEYYRLYVARYAWCSTHAFFLNQVHSGHRRTFASNFLKLGSYEYVWP